MSVLQPIFGRAMYVDSAITAGQPVSVTGDESVSPAILGTTKVIGIALMDGAEGEKITVELFTKGIVEVIADGAIAAGDLISAAPTGSAKSGAGDLSYGVALTAALDTKTLKVAIL